MVCLCVQKLLLLLLKFIPLSAVSSMHSMFHENWYSQSKS